MTTSTDSYAQVLYNTGEGLDFNDLNNMARFADARVLDQMLRATYRAALEMAATPTLDPELDAFQSTVNNEDFIFGLTGGGGYFVPTGTALQVTSRPGTIFQAAAVASGLDAKFLPFTLPSGVAFTLAAGDATNPRIDVIECQLAYVDGGATARDFKDATTGLLTSVSTNKTRKVQATVQVVQGTPGASPAYPALTAGFGALAAVYVPATHAAVFTRAHMRPMQIPIGVRVIDTPAFVLDRGNHANSWVVANGNPPTREIVAPASAIPVLATPPMGGQAGRVLGVGIYGSFAGTNVARLVRVSHGGGGAPTITELADLSATLCSNTPRYRHSNFQDLLAKTSGASDPGARSGVVGDAFWTNGHREGPAQEFMGQATYPSTTFDRLALELNGDALSIVAMVRWVIAGGL